MQKISPPKGVRRRPLDYDDYIRIITQHEELVIEQDLEIQNLKKTINQLRQRLNNVV